MFNMTDEQRAILEMRYFLYNEQYHVLESRTNIGYSMDIKLNRDESLITQLKNYYKDFIKNKKDIIASLLSKDESLGDSKEDVRWEKLRIHEDISYFIEDLKETIDGLKELDSFIKLKNKGNVICDFHRIENNYEYNKYLAHGCKKVDSKFLKNIGGDRNVSFLLIEVSENRLLEDVIDSKEFSQGVPNVIYFGYFIVSVDSQYKRDPQNLYISPLVKIRRFDNIPSDALKEKLVRIEDIGLREMLEEYKLSIRSKK